MNTPMTCENTYTLEHHQMTLHFLRTEDQFALCAFQPSSIPLEGEHIARPLVNLAVSGEAAGGLHTTTHASYALMSELKLEHLVQENLRLVAAYVLPRKKLRLAVTVEAVPETAVLRVHTAAENIGGEPVDIRFLSSAFLQGLCLGGLRDVFDPQRIRVHYCRQTWHGEGQWQTSSLEEMGLYKGSVIWCGCSASIQSVGSFPTSCFAPVMVIEDTESNSFWYVQLETAGSWSLELGYSGNYQKGGLYLLADAADENVGGWHHTLQPGERYTADCAAVGCLQGSWNDVLRELTRYRRTLAPAGPRPLVFNDYMNCIWGAPTDELLLPLIDRAAELGAEVFCIDSGWFTEPGRHWSGDFGDWLPGERRFGEMTLQGILDQIRRKGMRAGLWTEIEVCSDTARWYAKPDSCFLMRNGKRVEGGMRTFLNFTDPQVRIHIRNVLERLIGMGVTFFKNDYNLSTGIGADNLADSAAEGLRRNIDAFYMLLDEVRLAHPEVTLEGCASGGMRGDYKTLQHVDINSFSDQVDYRRCPSVITGCLCNILPEQLGVWCYPWPAPFENVDCTAYLCSEEYRRAMADTEQTVYNVINGMCGLMYLSGRIDCMDEANLTVLREGVEMFKQNRAFLAGAYPRMVAPHVPVGDLQSWQAAALEDEASRRMLLAVWRNGAADDVFEMDLGLAGKTVSIAQRFPTHIRDAKWRYNANSGHLTVQMPKNYTARLFEILVED